LAIKIEPSWKQSVKKSMNVKRKKQLAQYFLQINKAYRNLKYMKYDHELGFQEEMKIAIVNLRKIKLRLERMMEE
jgi:hypothetical protein